MYAYDDVTNNISTALSNAGQRIGFSYNGTGDATVMQINGLTFVTELQTDNDAVYKYYIVNAKTGRCLEPYKSSETYNDNDIVYSRYFALENTELWQLSHLSGTVYEVLFDNNNVRGLSTNAEGSSVIIDTVVRNDKFVPLVPFKFAFVANGDGTFKISTAQSNHQKYLYESDALHFKGSNDYGIRVAEYDEDDSAFKWYIVASNSGVERMKTEASYDPDGLYPDYAKDADENITDYTYNEKGQLTSVTDPKGTSTSYTYDVMGKTTDVVSGTSNVNYTYVKDMLNQISIDTGTLLYKFEYDEYGRKRKTLIGSNSSDSTYTLAEYIYTDDLLTKQKYGSSGTNYIDFTYDNLDRLVKKTYNGDASKYVEYFYDPNGNQYKLVDSIWGKQTLFEYDLADRINGVGVYDLTGIMRAYEAIRYNDGKGTVESMTHRMYGSDGALLKAMDYAYTYGDPAKGEIPDSLYKYEIGSDIDLTFTYDKLARLTHRNLITDSINKTESYTYKASERGGTYTTTLVESMTDLAGVTHTYVYDANGNILSDTYGGYTVSYEYDSLNRMTRYNDPVYGWTYVYVYDNRGNITEMHEHHYTAGDLGEPLNVYEYEYGDSIWADLLTSYWGEEISYDELGNPQNWIWGETLRWQNGRQLVSYDDSVNYTYNADGLRTGKLGDRTTEYYIVNGTYIGETTTIGTVQYRIIYLYDETGSVCGLEVTKIDGNTITTDTYYFAKNLQGDVTAILDAQGNVVANYRYDAYGAIISVTDANGNTISSATHIANLNPFRYRGYMYDEESGFYYLRSRYYDPFVGRFLNADGTVATGIGFDGFDMFAYCNSNPIMLSDNNGARPVTSGKPVKDENWVDKKMQRCYMQNIRFRLYSPQKKTFIEKLHNSDGTYSIYDSKRSNSLSKAHEQICVYEFEGLNVSFSQDSLALELPTIKHYEYTNGWEWNNIDISLFDFGYGEVGATVSPTVFTPFAMVSAWAPSAEFELLGFNIRLTGYVGAISTSPSFSVNNNGFSFAQATGVGFGINVSWE